MSATFTYIAIQIILLVGLTAVACYYDMRSRRIPNWISIVLFLSWIVIKVVGIELAGAGHIDMASGDMLYEAMCGVMGAAIMLALLAGCAILCDKIFHVTAPIGMGDLKILGTLALYFNLLSDCVLLFATCLSFAIFVGARRVFTKNKDNTAPMAPFIMIGLICAIITWIFI